MEITMNKEQLTAYIADKADITRREAKAAIESFTEAVTESLKKGEKVSLVGFGSFHLKHKSAFVARNPKTGEKINVSAKNTVSFKQGKALMESVN
jgi:DNA-binding protein HU-beta